MSWIPFAIQAGTQLGSAAISANQSDAGYQGPEMWQELFNFALSQVSSTERQRVLDEYEARADEQQAQALATAGRIGPETLATYDVSSNEALLELLGLRERMRTGAEDFYGEVAEDREEFLAGVEERGAGLMGGYRGGLADFLGGLGARTGDIMGGYEDRYLRAEAELEGYGEQMRTDIDRMFEEQQAVTTMNLLDRGLLSSTEAARQTGAVTERRTAEQRRLAEDLMRNRINVLGGMSGESLAAQERLGAQRAGYEYGGLTTGTAHQAALDASYAAYDAAMRGDEQAALRYIQEVDAISSGNIAGFYGQEAVNRSNIVRGGIQDFLSTIMAFNYVPPPQGGPEFQFGYQAGPSPQAATPWASFGAQAGQAIGQGAYNWLNRPTTTTTPSQYQTWEPTASQQGQWWAQAPANTYGVPPYLAPNPQYEYPITMD